MLLQKGKMLCCSTEEKPNQMRQAHFADSYAGNGTTAHDLMVTRLSVTQVPFSKPWGGCFIRY